MCFFLFFIRSEAQNSAVPVHFVSVEFGSVHARVLRLSAHRNTAAAAHSRAVHHKRIHADYRFYAVLFRKRAHGFHHGKRSHRHYAVVFALFQPFIERVDNKTFDPFASVVGCDNQIVAIRAEFAFVHDKFARSRSEYHVAVFIFGVQFFCLRENNGAAYSAAHERNAFIGG